MIQVNEWEIDVNHFPDGTLRLSLPEQFSEYGDGEFACINWYYENEEETLAVIYVTRQLQENGYSVGLQMPYIPNARQDRVINPTDVFTLKYFTEIINNLGFEFVKVMDAHSNVSLALLDRVQEAKPGKQIMDTIGVISDLEHCTLNDILLFFPDEGAMKRYSESFRGWDYVFGIKRRNKQTGQIEGLDIQGDVETIKDKVVLIIDDICSKGGTFYHSSKKLKELGAGKIYLYVTHCENTVLKGEMINSGLIEKIFTSDTIFTELSDKVEVIDYYDDWPD